MTNPRPLTAEMRILSNGEEERKRSTKGAVGTRVKGSINFGDDEDDDQLCWSKA